MSAAARTAATTAPITDITPAQALTWGFTPVPLCAHGDRKAARPKRWQLDTFAPEEWRAHEGTGLRCGRQADGTWLYFLDFDHRPQLGIDAPAQYAAVLARLPDAIRRPLFKAESTGRAGRYLAFRAVRELASTALYDEYGRKIGDFLGPGRQVVAPARERWIEGSLDAIPVLSTRELDTLLGTIQYNNTDMRRLKHGGARHTYDFEPVKRHLAHIDAIKRRVKAETRTGQHLYGDGGNDRSGTRAGIACHLRHNFHIPSDEITALLYAFTDWGHMKEKGSAWFEDDIVCCVRLAEMRYPDAHVEPTRYLQTKAAQPLPEAPRASRARKDRPQVLDADGLLALYSAHADDYDHIGWTQTETARRAGTSRATIARLEDELRERGDISNRKRGRNGGCLLILNRINMPKAEQPAAVLSAPPTAEPAASVDTISSEGLAHSNAENEQPRACVREKAHVARDVTPPAPPPMFAADGPLTAHDTGPGDYTQARIGPLPKRQRVDERSLEERHAKARRDLAALENGIKKRLGWGVDPASVSGARRKAGDLRRELAELEAQIAEQQPPPAEVQPPPPGEQLTLAPGPMATPEAAPIPAACVPPLPAAGDAAPVKPRPPGDYLYAVDYFIKRGEPDKARRIIDANPGRFDFGPELARLSAAD